MSLCLCMYVWTSLNVYSDQSKENTTKKKVGCLLAWFNRISILMGYLMPKSSLSKTCHQLDGYAYGMFMYIS